MVMGRPDWKGRRGRPRKIVHIRLRREFSVQFLRAVGTEIPRADVAGLPDWTVFNSRQIRKQRLAGFAPQPPLIQLEIVGQLIGLNANQGCQTKQGGADKGQQRVNADGDAGPVVRRSEGSDAVNPGFAPLKQRR